MNLFERIGIDVGRKLPLEEAVSWAAAHRVRFIDSIHVDTRPDVKIRFER